MTRGERAMQSSVDRTAGEVDWPAWADRTPTAKRTRTSKFSVTLASALNDIETELEDRLGVDDWRLSTAVPHRKSDGRPYADANPDDPAAVVRWSMDGEQYAVAADEYAGLRDNVRAIGLYLEEKRKMSNRPIHTGQSEFATARLPSAGEDAIAAPPAQRSDDVLDEEPHEVLDVSPDAPDEIVRAAFKAQVRDLNGHPDTGGSSGRFEKLKQAREELLDDD